MISSETSFSFGVELDKRMVSAEKVLYDLVF